MKLAPITLIYGPNSGGKSSLIQALMLLKQSIEAPVNRGARDRVLVPKGTYVDLGQSKSIHHKHDFSKQISFEVGITPSGKSPRLYSTFLSPGDEFRVQLKFQQRSENARLKLPALSEILYRNATSENLNLRLVRAVLPPSLQEQLEIEEFEDHTSSKFFSFSSVGEVKKFSEFLANAMKIPSETGKIPFFSSVDPSAGDSRIPYQVGFRQTFAGRTMFLPSSIKDLTNRDGKNFSMSDWPTRLLTDFAALFNHQFEKMSYLAPLRSRPKRIYELSQQYQGSIGLSGEFIVDALTSEIANREDNDEDVVSFVNTWLTRFEIPYTLEIKPIGDEVVGDIAMLRLLDNRTNVWVAATDVGFGIGQLLPVILQGALASKSAPAGGIAPVICIEQPEIHLHPRLQANVADYLIETISEDRCQWIIETHSEALMLRIQKRIREGTLSPELVSVVFVEPTGANGSRIVNLRLDEYGDFIDEWPGGFFEERFSEIFS